MTDSTTIVDLFTRWEVPRIGTTGLALSAIVYRPALLSAAMEVATPY